MSPKARPDNSFRRFLLWLKRLLCVYLVLPFTNLNNDRRHEMASLNGTVTASGKPQPGATVTALSPGTSNALGEARTGADGTYNISNLPAGATVEVVATASGSRSAPQTVTLGRTAMTLNIDISSSGVSSATTATTPTSTSGGGPAAGTDSGASESGVTSGTPATSDTSATTPSTAPPASSATSVTALDEAAFNALRDLVASADFAPEPPVNIPEAKEARRLFTVGVYVLAKVPESISRLNEALKNNGRNGLNLINKNTLLANNDARIQSILTRRTNDFNDEASLLNEVRREFDLGTGSAASVNSEFKNLYREFVNLCSDNLLGIDPNNLSGSGTVVIDFKQKEEVINFLRSLKRAIQRLVQNMSIVGTLGTQSLVSKWSEVLTDSLNVLNNVAKNHVASDDEDQRTANALLAALTNTTAADVKSYATHGRDGATLLDYAIRIYEVIQAGSNLENEADNFLRDLFYRPGFVFNSPGDPQTNGKATADVLKLRASLVRDYFRLPTW